MSSRNRIHELDTYNPPSTTDESSASSAPASTGDEGNPLEDALGGVLGWEQGNVEFWLLVAQTAFLLGIYLEMRGGS